MSRTKSKRSKRLRDLCPTPNKRVFCSQDDAITAAIDTSHLFALRPYACTCGCWHLTHQTFSQREERIWGVA